MDATTQHKSRVASRFKFSSHDALDATFCPYVHSMNVSGCLHGRQVKSLRDVLVVSVQTTVHFLWNISALATSREKINVLGRLTLTSVADILVHQLEQARLGFA